MPSASPRLDPARLQLVSVMAIIHNNAALQVSYLA
jgi:hypothetical protein